MPLRCRPELGAEVLLEEVAVEDVVVADKLAAADVVLLLLAEENLRNEQVANLLITLHGAVQLQGEAAKDGGDVAHRRAELHPHKGGGVRRGAISLVKVRKKKLK